MIQTLIPPQTHTDLDSSHYNEWINGSAISPLLTHKWIEHYSSPRAIADLLGWKSYNHTPGWAVRSVDPLTGNRTLWGQFKPNEPLLFPDSDKPAKYFSFPKNGQSDPLFSVMVLNEWVIISETVGVSIDNEDIDENSEDLGFWRWVIKNPTIPIVITEGAKKAGSLLSHGHVTIALAGVWNGQNKKKLHPILKHFLVPGRQVYLAFDADVIFKQNVEAALKLFGELCQSQNASVHNIQWPLELGKGVDDLIVKRGVEAFRAAMEEAKSYGDWRKSLEDKYRAASLRDEENNNDNNNTGNKKHKKPPSPTRIAQKLFHKYRELLAWDDAAQTWMRYQSLTNGTWSPESNLATLRAIAAELEADPNIGLNYSKNYLTEVVFHLRLKVLVKEWVQADSRQWLPMLDGVLELATMKLHPHSPGFRFTWCLPYKWSDRHLGCQPIQNWLSQIMGRDPLLAELLRAYLRAIVTGSTDLQKFLEIVGPGGTGKSTYLKLAQALVGNENCVVTELKHLEQNRFELATLIHKRLVVITDADRYGGSVNTLKAITGEDHLRIEKKHIQADGKGIKSKAMVLIAANEVIQSSDYTSGLGRRRLTLSFQNQVPEDKQQPLIEIESDGISGDFAPYLPGLLEWVLDMSSERGAPLRDRMRQLVKDTAVSIPHLNRIRLEKLCDTNPLADWADFCLSVAKNARTYIGIAKKDKSPDSPNIYIGVSQWIYPSYCEYTTATGHKPISQRRFTGLLHDLLVCQLKLNDITRGKDRNGSYFDGIRIRTDDDLSPRIISGTEPPTIDPDIPLTGSNISSNNINCDGSSSIGDGSVMARTVTGDGCDGCD